MSNKLKGHPVQREALTPPRRCIRMTKQNVSTEGRHPSTLSFPLAKGSRSFTHIKKISLRWNIRMGLGRSGKKHVKCISWRRGNRRAKQNHRRPILALTLVHIFTVPIDGTVSGITYISGSRFPKVFLSLQPWEDGEAELFHLTNDPQVVLMHNSRL